MAMNIKNPETERLAREAARVSGQSLTGVITTALREYLERRDTPTTQRDRYEQLMAISRRTAPQLEGIGPADRAADFLYDDDGLPA